METDILKKAFLKAEKKATVIRGQTLKRVLNEYGSKTTFLHSLGINLIDSPDDIRFRDVYRFYTSFFTLPNETESFEGFNKTLKLNGDSDLIRQYGRFQEAWLYATPHDKPGNIIAGVNFSVYELDQTIQSETNATGHIIYIFVKPQYRSLGLARYMLDLAQKNAADFMGNQNKILWICEQNAPEKMTAEEYFADNKNALIDQCDRLIWWDKLGYKRLKFNYIQPPLNPGQEACTTLTLNVKVDSRFTIPAAIIRSHLERFFMLAIFKGEKDRIDSFYTSQMQWLENQKSIALEGDEAYYKHLKSKFYQ